MKTMQRTMLVLAMLVLGGCASVHMKKEGVVAKSAGPDSAKVVFLRHSFVGSAISASLFDVSKEQETFIGIHENGTRIEYLTTPGEHLFMVVGESADFMAANVEAGKTYYAITTPRIGAWKARFSLIPIRAAGEGEFTTQSKEFKTWVADPLVEINPESEAWYQKNRTDINQKRKEYIVKWNEKPADDKKQRSLLVTDGM